VPPHQSPATAHRLALALALAVTVASVASSGRTPIAQSAPSILITNAVVVDGTGSPGRRASVRITGDRITAAGDLTPAATDRVVEARGLTLAPGFIDTHSHHDRGIADAPDALPVVSQGITTIVAGQDGSSSYPLEEWVESRTAKPAAVNVASYIGHGTLRRLVMKDDYKRKATAAEVAAMERLAEQEMKSGALGLSTGLEYDPGIYSDPGEVLAIAKVVARAGGRYISHIRSEDRKFFEAVGEVIAIGKSTGMPVQISHIKLAMRGLWGQTDKLLKVLDRARADGVRLTADIYPYTYWRSGMTVLFPGRDFTNRAEAEFILRELVAPEGLLIVGSDSSPEYVGKTLAQIAALRRTDAARTMMALIEESKGSGPGIVATAMNEKDVERLMQWPHANICSDGTTSGGHPRGFGTFPRVLGRYVRERHAFTLAEAIRKMTSLSAANVGITDRGRIAAGQYADLVLFDPATVVDHATTSDAKALSTGIQTVWVNGEVVFEKGVSTSARPGRVLRRNR
jgi:N-acyl-D-amino-acid deacylase